MLLASLFGGIYSLVILVPDISDFVISLSRLPALGFMVFLAFGIGSIKEYLKSVLFFLGINLVFAGAVFMLWFLVYPENMYFNSGVVYFDIDALTLVLLTVGAYAVIRIISLFTKNKMPDNLIYTVRIYVSDKEFFCKGFFDSGNSLCDPFSGEGVIIINADVVKEIITEDIFYDFSNAIGDIKIKLIPVKSLSGTKLLPSFRVDRIIITGFENNITLDNPVIALCKEKIHGGEYGALLYSTVFDNAI